mgnify:CR=1 FL=1
MLLLDHSLLLSSVSQATRPTAFDSEVSSPPARKKSWKAALSETPSRAILSQLRESPTCHDNDCAPNLLQITNNSVLPLSPSSPRPLNATLPSQHRLPPPPSDRRRRSSPKDDRPLPKRADNLALAHHRDLQREHKEVSLVRDESRWRRRRRRGRRRGRRRSDDGGRREDDIDYFHLERGRGERLELNDHRRFALLPRPPVPSLDARFPNPLSTPPDFSHAHPRSTPAPVPRTLLQHPQRLEIDPR